MVEFVAVKQFLLAEGFRSYNTDEMTVDFFFWNLSARSSSFFFDSPANRLLGQVEVETDEDAEAVR